MGEVSQGQLGLNYYNVSVGSFPFVQDLKSMEKVSSAEAFRPSARLKNFKIYITSWFIYNLNYLYIFILFSFTAHKHVYMGHQTQYKVHIIDMQHRADIEHQSQDTQAFFYVLPKKA